MYFFQIGYRRKIFLIPAGHINLMQHDLSNNNKFSPLTHLLALVASGAFHVPWQQYKLPYRALIHRPKLFALKVLNEERSPKCPHDLGKSPNFQTLLQPFSLLHHTYIVSTLTASGASNKKRALKGKLVHFLRGCVTNARFLQESTCLQH